MSNAFNSKSIEASQEVGFSMNEWETMYWVIERGILLEKELQGLFWERQKIISATVFTVSNKLFIGK